MWILVLATIFVIVLGVFGFRAYRLLGPWIVKRPPLLPLPTRWSDKMNPESPLPEYPRPQLRRERWTNLNGRWDFTIQPDGKEKPEHFSDEIIVPFPIESELSGVQKSLSPGQAAWYRRTFEATQKDGERLMLHFGAVDHGARVWVDDKQVGDHRGGFTSFSFDITDALSSGPTHEIVVAVTDPTEHGSQARGKQTLDPRAIWYTAVSGIWQTVWIEPVAASHIERVYTTTDISEGQVSLLADIVGARAGDVLEVEVVADGNAVTRTGIPVEGNKATAEIRLPNLRPWSPDDPFLYDLRLSLSRDGAELDHAGSYFGAREIQTKRDGNGIWRLFLNGKPVFHLGLLDQGWWPDGLYTAPTDEALAFDIEASLEMGFNTIRKHVKVEPARWYWHADRLGVLVWQDMPTGGPRPSMAKEVWWAMRRTPHEERGYKLSRPADEAAEFRRELRTMVEVLRPFPSIVVWVPFNEAWGQFDTDDVLAEVKALDPSRLVDGPSGWIDTGTGDLRDHHKYFQEKKGVEQEPGRPVVWGEFGGLAHTVQEHLAVSHGFGYRTYEDRASLEEGYARIVDALEAAKEGGLAGAIYTQTTDVEGEINGLLTYDRAVFKIPAARLRELHRRLLA
jgi:beta-galactosidase/beta-glucuronidase